MLKKELYRKSAVVEYWLVDPDDHIVEQYVLHGDAYRLLGRHADQVAMQSLDNVRVALSDVW